jgi:hypothetical protein
LEKKDDDAKTNAETQEEKNDGTTIDAAVTEEETKEEL